MLRTKAGEGAGRRDAGRGGSRGAGPAQWAALAAGPGCAWCRAVASPAQPCPAPPGLARRPRAAALARPAAPSAGRAMAAPGNIVSVMASKTKTKKKHFVAQKVKLFRASDPLLSVLMWGVNHSVSAGRAGHWRGVPVPAAAGIAAPRAGAGCRREAASDGSAAPRPSDVPVRCRRGTRLEGNGPWGERGGGAFLSR